MLTRLSRQRIMGLLIIKDGVIQVERYQYDRKPEHRFVSNSIAKSITSLAVGLRSMRGKSNLWTIARINTLPKFRHFIRRNHNS